MAVTPRNCKIPTTSNVDEDNGDRLSSLPEHIIHHIFSFLDNVDVVRASSVSRNWSYPNFRVLPVYSLYLSMVEFLDSMLLGTFVSSCPVLESLTMHNCKFHDFKILDISAPRLKNLTINALASANVGLFNCEVIVACPSLVSFNLLGMPSGLSFPGTNSLQNVYIFFNHGPEHRTVEECHHLMDSILRGICNIKVLKLSAAFLRFLLLAVAKPECSASFYNLKSSTLLVSVGESDQSIIQLLNHSPNLEALTIIFALLAWSECWEIPDEVTSSADHLKSVRLLDFGGSENELELVRFLLKKGLVLEKLSIARRRGVENLREII